MESNSYQHTMDGWMKFMDEKHGEPVETSSHQHTMMDGWTDGWMEFMDEKCGTFFL